LANLAFTSFWIWMWVGKDWLGARKGTIKVMDCNLSLNKRCRSHNSQPLSGLSFGSLVNKQAH
jgi:hypothetical protein